jgi:hypothetical protein
MLRFLSCLFYLLVILSFFLLLLFLCFVADLQFLFYERDGFLMIEELPWVFEARYGKIPPQIFVRDCYIRLYEIASGLMYDGSMDSGATLFTGVPGIGKSLFLVYFIFRFLHDDRFEDKRFSLQFLDQIFIHFSPTADGSKFSCTRQIGDLLSRRVLLLCDISSQAEPAWRSKWNFIFSSPSPRRYKEIMKNAPSFRFTMPTWSEQELERVNRDKDQWYDNFVTFGGVPRHVLIPLNRINSGQLLENSLVAKGGQIAQNFFKFGHGSPDLDQSYMLVHINPPVSDSGDFVCL